jgi:hypothetical protein
MKPNIISCFVKSTGARPSTLRDTGIDRIIHRTIIDWAPYMGTYGMGGPGFFGLRLEQTELFPDEWMVLTLWGAMEWLTIDDRWLHCSRTQYAVQKPLYTYDDSYSKVNSRVNGLLIGYTIEEAEITDDMCNITLEKDTQTHLLEIPMDSSKLPLRGGTMEPHEWNSEESPLDAWVVHENGLVLMTTQ